MTPIFDHRPVPLTAQWLILKRFMRRFLIGLATVLACQAGVAAGAAPSIEGHFSLLNKAGQLVTERTYQGKWTLIYFGYATCPEICSTVMQRVALAMEELGPATEKLQPLFITLDPTNDTPEQLSLYLASFDKRMIGLTGSEKQTKDAVQAFRMYVKTRSLDSGGTTIDHSSYLFLMRPDGSFARLLSGDTSGHNLAGELQRQLQ